MSELRTLLTPDALRAIDDLPAMVSSDDVLREVTRLRKAGLSPEFVSAVVGQARLRTRGESKFGDLARRMLFTKDGLEQSTRLAIGIRHAARLRQAGIARVADLGCGIGGDALAFAGAGISVTAVDADEATAGVAAYNLAPFGEDAVVRHGRAEDADLTGVDAVWIDPARRTSTGGQTTRLADPADWSPALDWVFDLATRMPAGIKLSPAFRREDIPAGVEAQWISVDGSTVELVLWTRSLARQGVARAALVVRDGVAHELTAAEAAQDEAVRELGAFVHEPEGAVIRAQLIGTVARALGAGMLTDGVAYLTGDEPVTSPFVATFRVREVLPADTRSLAKALRARDIGTLEIKKRGVDVDPAALRTKLSLRGANSATLILAPNGRGRLAILADRV